MSIVFISISMARCTYMKTVLKQTFSRLLFACIVKRHIYIVQTLDNDASRYIKKKPIQVAFAFPS